ncbi:MULTISPECIES: hypothetical protein [Pseudonocardia]|uniref:Uncharacterized protein n=2 Tax=Pseudonocardia TaxID=1847 RepID=A0A1Y2N6U3_PSEAH|nr:MULTISPECIES: hypothetical protein [Pseudonocardia]OSY43196.1 hypothetical protein BG845_00801 [Pseudonocardia autotrophica]TDN71684.1 hypothetical protein C8E95_0718 [Pseudonocardia autotrophica]BBG02371.1 hypothetical protein Pdca_35800 [Pseudonocardia autotrophica]GEC23293.1 hypothetical protein PSA01_03220 [Pseudonocardia saturnea]
MDFVPVLDLVAARMAGVPVGARTDPARWAYHLRDAIALARPDWVVTHHDPLAEPDAVREAGGDPLDRPLATAAAVEPLVELTRVLAGLFPRATVAASLTGPVAMARALAGADPGGGPAGEPAPDLVADCADALAELASAQVQAGARRLLVWEDAASLAGALDPLLRRAATLGTPVVVRGGTGPGATGGDGAGSVLHAGPDGDGGALLVDPAVVAAGSAGESDEPFGTLWRRWRAVPGARLVLTDGPLPLDCDLGRLREAGERPG